AYLSPVAELARGGQRRLASLEYTAAQVQRQSLGYHRTADPGRGPERIPELGFLLKGGDSGPRSRPAAASLSRGAVYHPGHGVGAVEGGHRTTDDLHAFDRRGRREKACLGFAESVGRHVARRILPTAVHQDQRILGRHPAEAYV